MGNSQRFFPIDRLDFDNHYDGAILITLFVVLYMMAVPVWICVIAIGIICGILLTMYDSAKRTRLK